MAAFCPAVEQSQLLMLVGNKTELRPGLAERVHTDQKQLAIVSSSSSGPHRPPLPAPAPGLPVLRDQRQGRHQRGGRRRCIWLGEEPRLPRDALPCCRIGLTPLLWPCREVKGPIGAGLSTGLDPVARRTAPRCCRTGNYSWARPGRAAARLSPGAQARPPSLHRRPPTGPEPRLRPGSLRRRAARLRSSRQPALPPAPGRSALSPRAEPRVLPQGPPRPDPTFVPHRQDAVA